MFKTHIDIPRRNYIIYYMVLNIITMRNNWDVIATTVTRPDHIRIYFLYKWFQYGKVRALKKEVKKLCKKSQILQSHICP